MFELSFQAIRIWSGDEHERLVERKLLGAAGGCGGGEVGVRVGVRVGEAVTRMVTSRVTVPPQPRAVSL